MIKKYELYVVPGSRHCIEARDLLERKGVPIKIIVLNNRDLLNAAPYDLGIQKAPALYVKGQWYQGIEGIREFVMNGKY